MVPERTPPAAGPTPDGPPARLPPGLRRLAHAWGVQTAYHDIRGRRVHASADALVAVLAALGAPLHRAEDARDALAARMRARWRQPIEPVVVAWDGRPAAVELRLPVRVAEGRAHVRLDLESGETREATLDLAAAPTLAAADVDGEAFVIKRVALAEGLAPGRHVVRLEAPGVAAQAHLIAAPTLPDAASANGAPSDRTPDTAPAWGAFVPLYALRTARSTACGDLTDLDALGAWVGEHGGRVVSTLPLLPTFLDEALFQPSPYLPVSRLAWNELYVDLAREPEWARVAAADAGTARACAAPGAADHEAAATADLGRTDLIDYRALAARRRPLLASMAQSAFDSPRRAQIERFLDEHPQLRAYARFRAACVKLGKPWCHWDEPARDGRLTDDDVDGPAFRAHAYAQFVADGQMRALSDAFAARGQRLLLDLPLGVHRDGYDVWSRRSLFVEGASCGAPPDAFFAQGQDWGLPPVDPDAARRQGYAYLTDTLRHHLGAARMLRIDHAPGLHRLFWVPHGFPANEGVYVRGHPEEIYAVLCLEAARIGAQLIGEDLGTVPPGLRAELARHGMWRTHVLQFTAHARVPRRSLACLNTHDTPPFAGFVRGRDVDDARDLGVFDDAKACAMLEARAGLVADLRTWLEEREGLAPGADRHAFMTACYARLAASRTSLVLLNLEDLWEEERPQNVPGTSDERPNWRRPARLTFEDFRDDPAVRATLATVDARRGEAGRRPRRVEAEAPPSPIGALDLDLLAQGRHAHVDDLLGSHRGTRDGVQGSHFVAWAPGAEAATVVGDFNGWDPQRNPMRRVGRTDLWEAFVPGARRRALYKFLARGRDGAVRETPDPFAVRTERPPGDASMIWSLDYDWTDHAWVRARAERALGAQRDGGTARDDATDGGAPRAGGAERAPAIVIQALTVPGEGWSSLRWTPVQAEGATHLVLPLDARRPHGAGLAPAPGHGPPQELMAAVDALHQRGLGLLVAWSPPDAAAFGIVDDRADAASRPEVRSLQVSAALFWVRHYHADGLLLTSGDGAPAAPALREDLGRALAARHPGVVLVDA